MNKPVTKGRLQLSVLPQEWHGGRPIDCEDGPRPCKHSDCRYHLSDGRGDGPRMSDGGRMINPDARPGRRAAQTAQITETCAIDVAEEGPRTLAMIGGLLGLSRTLVGQIEKRAMKKYQRAMKAEGEACGGKSWRWRG
jgi:hypothetical protein